MGILNRLFGKKPSREAFAEAALATMGRAGFANPVYDAAEFIVVSDSQTIGLYNMYRTYCSLPPAERAPFLDRTFASFRDSPEPATFADVREMLMPMLRTRAESTQLKGPAVERGVRLVERPFSEDLVLAVVIDTPNMVKRVRVDELEEWGIDEELAYSTALHNLRLQSADAWEQVARGVYRAAWQDAFDVTRIVFPDLIRRVPIEGEPVVMTPNRDCLLVASAREPEALRAMAAIAVASFDDEPYNLSIQPLLLRDEGWEPFDIGEDATRQIQQRWWRARAEDYRMQANAYAGRDDVVFAHLHHDGRPPAGEFATLTTWDAGVATFLPKADAFVLRREDVEVVCPWDDAARILRLVPDPDLWPPRYFVSGAPTQEQFEQLSVSGEVHRRG
jgi:propanediol dehydratase small subunit